MEEIKKMEQPFGEIDLKGVGQGEGISQQTENEENNGTKTQKEISHGSILEKFKDVESLCRAYENLQSDYTKKCQSLSNLQSDYTKVCEDFSNLQKETEDNKGKLLPEAEAIKNWESKVNDFLDKNPNACDFQDKIVEFLKNNDDILKQDNSLEIAWGEVAKRNLISNKELASNQAFLENFILNNEQIKDTILKRYFENVSLGKTPTVIGGQKGAKTLVSAPSKPKTIKDATRLVEDMFN